MSNLNTLIDMLAHASTNDDAFNLYAPHDDKEVNANNQIRRENLKLYLQIMQERTPKSLMVMEAPGYRGCRLTGIPVTSRKVMLEGVPELKLLGTDQGFQNVDDEGFEDIYGEQSATIVWTTLAQLGHTPLIWNTFPFHPHKKDKPRTNRRPRKSEMRQGGELFHSLLDLFEIKQIIAIGNVAHETLSEFELESVKVRHPAQGGKNDFVAGLTQYLRT